MGEFNSDDHHFYYCGQESLRRNEVAIMVNKRVRNAVLGCNLKNDRLISVCFQGKPFSITVIQVYALTSNAEEAKVEQLYEDVQDLLELKPKKRCPFHYRGLEFKSRNSRRPCSGRIMSNMIISEQDAQFSRTQRLTATFPAPSFTLEVLKP